MSERINDSSSHQVGENKSPTKRTPSKRMSRAQRESEELIKNMGGNLDVEGGRKTRSSTRGRTPSTPSTPTPAKKPKISGTPRRGRPKRNIALDDDKTESDGESAKTEESLKSKDKEGVDSKDEHTEVDASDKKNEVVNKEHKEDESNKVEPSLPSIAEESSDAKEDETDGKKEENENNNQSEKTDEEVVKTVDQPTSNNKDKVDIKDDGKCTIPVVKDSEVEPMEVDGSEKVEEKSAANVVENNLTKTEEAITIDSSPESEDRSDDVVEVPEDVSKESVPSTEKPDEKEKTKSVENCSENSTDKSTEVDKEPTKTDVTVEESKNENESKCEKTMKTLSQEDTVQACN